LLRGSATAGSPPRGGRRSLLAQELVEQTPNPDSRIGLASERDALGLNRAAWTGASPS
jgi:hypothetical protein